jgi:hypothetical protein
MSEFSLMRVAGRRIRLHEEAPVAAVDEGYEDEPGGGMDDALDELDPEERQPPSDEEAEQDDYANTDDQDA